MAEVMLTSGQGFEGYEIVEYMYSRYLARTFSRGLQPV